MPIEKITSRKSSVVKNAAALLQKAENRSEAGLFMAEGARLCADAARSQTEIAACFFTENAAKKYKDYLDPVLKQTEHAYCIEEHIAPMLSDTKNPQGIFCVCRMPKRRADGLPVSAESDTRPCRHVLVMENIQDPSNMGNVLRGSMGAVFRLGIRRFETAEDCLKVLHAENITSLAAVPDSAATPITTIPFETGNWAVWIGNEGNGLTNEAIEHCHDRVTIPMRGRAESFNASTAAAIVLWEMERNGAGGTSHG